MRFCCQAVGGWGQAVRGIGAGGVECLPQPGRMILCCQAVGGRATMAVRSDDTIEAGARAVGPLARSSVLARGSCVPERDRVRTSPILAC